MNKKRGGVGYYLAERRCGCGAGAALRLERKSAAGVGCCLAERRYDCGAGAALRLGEESLLVEEAVSSGIGKEELSSRLVQHFSSFEDIEVTLFLCQLLKPDERIWVIAQQVFSQNLVSVSHIKEQAFSHRGIYNPKENPTARVAARSLSPLANYRRLHPRARKQTRDSL